MDIGETTNLEEIGYGAEPALAGEELEDETQETEDE
jgi:hypothetical protein